ncbi:MAG: hypothetical protein M1834_005748 [Cirrosporium novae-zelandiae]|nr:MAG: hypothetical protein M1834_005748 [Cirrosporium novae-zelandiae]
MPQMDNDISPHTFSDNFASPEHGDTTGVDTVMSDAESELSDVQGTHNDRNSSPSLKREDSLDDNSNEVRSDPSSVETADGVSQDEDFEEDNDSVVSEEDHSKRHSSSTSSESKRPAKRKAGVEDDEYIINNPELYGLRRSGRAHPKRRIIDDSSEDNNNNNESDSDIVVGRSRPRRKAPTSQKSSKHPTPTLRSVSESDGSSDSYGGSRAHSSRKQRRRLLQSAASSAPTHAELRFSTRRAARVSNYNEDDNDDMFAEDESELTPNYWITENDNRPAIDVVLNHRHPDEAGEAKEDFEYYIKWQGKAHVHATWESMTELINCRSVRRLDNYFKRFVIEDIRIRTDPDVPLEEKEKWILDRERDLDAINDYTKAERVISIRTNDEGKGLYYESCTWESAELIANIAQNEIDRYQDRISRRPVSNKEETNPKTRRKFVSMKEQPSYIVHGKLKDFQIHGVNFLAYNWCKAKNVILADEMGLGKTVQTVAFINWLRHDRQQNGPFIVVVPLSTMPSWAETFDNWTPDVNYVVYNGNEASRNIIKEYELLEDGNPKRAKFHVLLTTYEYILQDATFLGQLKWQFMAVDEAHRLKNRDSQLYTKLLDFKAPSRLLITGTPMQNTLGELSALMDFLMPGAVKIDEEMDIQSEAAVEKIKEIQTAIAPFMLRRTKQKVENDLPPKSEKIIRVELSDVQLEYYKHILTKNYAALNQGAKGPKQSLLNIMMELKKASNHPFMFLNAEQRIMGENPRREDYLKSLITSSGKMMLLDQLLMKLKRDNHRVLIFSQMVKMLDILGEYLHLRGYQFQRLDGTVAASARRIAIDHYNAPDSHDFCFLLSTRAGGLGINLMTADTVVLFDSDWNPQADLQAMARAHRIGQTKPVMIYRLVSKETVEEEVLERARNKLMLEFITIQRGVTDKKIQEAADKAAKSGRTTEPTSAEDISLILKRRGQKMFEQTGNQKKLEELDIDAVLANAEEHKTEQAGIETDGGEEFLKSFEYMDVKLDLEWDDIIPKDQLEKIKAEEKSKADAKFLENMIEQNAPRKRKSQAVEDRDERAAKKQARALAAAETDEQSDEVQSLDPKRPLVEKEYRNLIRAFLRYGSIDERGDELVRDARLESRDRELLKLTLQDVISISQRLLKEEAQRVEAIERESNKLLTKKDRKAVLFDYHGVKRVNAETIVERPEEMRMLREVTNVSDPVKYRLIEATKTASYSCEWGQREDGMLLVGISRHGFGAWTDIRDDPRLGLKDKLFLEEHRIDKKAERSATEEKSAKSPGAVHLVRRADYLLSVLKEKVSNGTNAAARRAVENHHRNQTKQRNGPHARRSDGNSISASPAPSFARRGQREVPERRNRDRPFGRNGHRDSVERRTSHGEFGRHTPRPDSRHTHEHHHTRQPSRENGRASSNDSSLLKLVFKDVKDSLKLVQNATKEGIPNKMERARVLREEFRKIGMCIKNTLQDMDDEPDGDNDLERRLWTYVANYWPNPGTKAEQLQNMFERLIGAEVAQATKAVSKSKAISSTGSHPSASTQVNGQQSPSD